MIFWIDAQLPPALAHWLREDFNIEAFPVRDLGLLESSDKEIYFAARFANVNVLTKDSDFIELLYKNGPPPNVLWLTCGNTSKAALRPLLRRTIQEALSRFAQGESLVEIQ